MHGFRGADGREGLDLIGEIYDTGTGLGQWKDLLGSVSRFVGATSGTMGITDMTTSRSAPEIYLHGLDEHIVEQRWLHEFGFQDVWAEAGYAPGEAEICTGAQLRDVDETRRLAVYSAVHEPLGIGDCLVTSLQTSGARVMFFSLYRPASRGLFGREEIDRLQPLAPHLVRAAHLQSLIERTELHDRARRAALDELRFAVFAVVGGVAEPLNSRAEHLLSSGCWLRNRNGRIEARDASSDASLQHAIEAAGGGSHRAEPSIATPFPIRTDVHSLPLPCWAIPVDGTKSVVMGLVRSAGCALLFVGDPARDQEVSSESIQALFDLTPAEARVAAAVASGETLGAYAKRRGLSEHTVRWTFKRVQSKLNAPRQLDVARMISDAMPGGRR